MRSTARRGRSAWGACPARRRRGPRSPGRWARRPCARWKHLAGDRSHARRRQGRDRPRAHSAAGGRRRRLRRRVRRTHRSRRPTSPRRTRRRSSAFAAPGSSQNLALRTIRAPVSDGRPCPHQLERERDRRTHSPK